MPVRCLTCGDSRLAINTSDSVLYTPEPDMSSLVTLLCHSGCGVRTGHRQRSRGAEKLLFQYSGEKANLRR